jgi:hypothetical protein
MDTSEGTKSGGRKITAPRGKRPLYVWVTPEERAEIERLAASAGLAVSVYLRTLGLAYEPKSILDAKNVRDLLKACGDLGRLGGLLKLWLVEKPGQGASVVEIRQLLEQIQEAREAIVEKVAAV